VTSILRSLAIALALGLLAACAQEAAPGDAEGLLARADGDHEGDDEGDGSDPFGSETPRIDLEEGTASDAAYFLTEADVQQIEGMADVDLIGTDELQYYENPDPRSFCGDEIDSPAIPHDFVARTFASSETSVLQLLGAYDDEVRDGLAEERAASYEGCPAFESTTNTGATQRVSDIHLLDLTGVGDDQFGGTATIEVGRQRVEVVSIAVAVGDRVSALQVFTSKAPSDDELRDLAVLMAERLGS